MRIFIDYNSTDQPYGGGNSFMKAFQQYCEEKGVTLAGSINDKYDILFFNAAAKGPNEPHDLTELFQQKYYGKSGFLKKFIRGRTPKKLIYRVDGFRAYYADMGRNRGDCLQRCCCQLADHVIFQSELSLEMAQSPKVGFGRTNYSVVHNGVDQGLFELNDSEPWDGDRKLRVFSASWSKNPNKGFGALADFSEFEEVEVSFCGRWPKEQIDPKNVTVMPPKPQAELAEEYGKHDVFMLVSKYDTCPNACLEALSSGLPIVYHELCGIKELADDCGLAYNEENPRDTLDELLGSYPDMYDNVRERRHYFSMERCGQEYLSVFRDVLDS